MYDDVIKAGVIGAFAGMGTLMKMLHSNLSKKIDHQNQKIESLRDSTQSKESCQLITQSIAKELKLSLENINSQMKSGFENVQNAIECINKG